MMRKLNQPLAPTKSLRHTQSSLVMPHTSSGSTDGFPSQRTQVSTAVTAIAAVTASLVWSVSGVSYAQTSASSSDRTSTPSQGGPTSAPPSFGSFAQRLQSPVAELRLNATRNSFQADGVGSIDVVLDVLDNAGKALQQVATVTLEVGGGARLQLPARLTTEAGADAGDVDNIVPATQVRIERGQVKFKVIAPMQPGEFVLRASVGGRQVELPMSATPDQREMFVVGLVEVQARGNKFDPSKILPPRENDGLDQELRAWRREFGNGKGYVATRAAVYLKGLVSGSYLLTLSYDSEKAETKRLFQDVDPNGLYPVYGDSSVRGIDGQSSSRLYVRLDKNKSWVQYGDFNTGGGNNSLSGYSRSLTGVKAHYEEGALAANIWIARDTLRQIVDEFPGRGVSGPYSMSNPNGVQGSEKVELVVRDRNQPSVILKVTLLQRFSDYEFEPFSGRILFKSPVPSVDESLNPVSIRITYEVEQGGSSFTVAGGDVQLKLAKSLTMGASVARDANPASPYKVVGAAIEGAITDKLKLKAEVARTDGVPNSGSSVPASSGATAPIDTTGSAVRLELTHDGDDFRGRAFAAKAQEGFNNPNSGITGGRTELGAQAALRLSKELSLKADVRRSEDTTNDRRADGISLGVEYKLSDKLSLEAGVRRTNQNASALQQTGNIACNGTLTTPAGQSGYNTGFGINPNGGQQIDPNTGLPVVCNSSTLSQAGGAASTSESTNSNVYLRGRYEITTQVAVSAELSRDNSEDSANPAATSRATLYSLGLEYRPYDKARVYLRHEQSRSLTGLYGLGSGDKIRLTTLGVDTEYMTDGYLFSEYRLRDSISGRDLQNAIGLRNGWNIAPGLKLLTNAEVLRTSATVASTSTAPGSGGTANPGNLTKSMGVGLEYTANPLWKASGRFEWRDDNQATNTLTTLGIAGKLTRDLTLIARDYISVTKPDAGGRSTQNRLQLGFAYRPVDTNTLDALGLYERKTEKDTTIATGTNRSANILSLRLNYHPSRPWWVSGRAAYKQVRENLVGIETSYAASLLSGRVMYDITNRWSVGANLSTLQGRDARQYAYGLEVGYTVMDNLWLVGGYTWRGFSDTDLALDNYTNRGWYLGVRYKFDEDLFGAKSPSVNKSLVPSTPANSGDKK
jgi:hypothetical protein